jgi:AcrR family transcriptional regulator
VPVLETNFPGFPDNRMKMDICSVFSLCLKPRGERTAKADVCNSGQKAHFVRHPVCCSEEPMTLPGHPVTDRRIQKTQNLLREALVSLIHEKNYDAIVVKEILDRANVGRSTFYTHFRDKDELLVSGIHDMLRSLQSTKPPSPAKLYERIIWFSLPIFEYHDQHRRNGEAKIGARGRAILHEHLQKVLADLIADDVRKDLRGRRKTAVQIPPDLLVQHVASTFIQVLNWWMESRSLLPAKEVNDLFRALILPTLAATWETKG